jgi:hypothetical protein
MLREYFIVCTTVADIPEGVDPTMPILNKLFNGLSAVQEGKLDKYLANTFSVIEGDLVELYDEE